MRKTPTALWRRLTRGLRALTNSRAADQDLQDELTHYVEQLVASRLAAGMSPADARRAAVLEVGNQTNIREGVRASLWETTVSSALADLRYSLRTLARNPVFTLVVVGVIAVGVGAVTTVFSGVNAYLLKPLPGASDASSLLQIDRTKPATNESTQASYSYYQHLRQNSRQFSGIAAWSKVDLTISRANGGISAYGAIVSDNYFSVLGAQPALGRYFLPGEDQNPGSHALVVVSHDFWREYLNADSAVVGKTVGVNGQPYTLIGVAAPEFHGVFTPLRTAAWVTLSMQPQLKPLRSLDGNTNWLWLYGRLRGESSQSQADLELRSLLQSYASNADEPRWARDYLGIRTFTLTGLPDDAHKDVAAFLGVLLAAAVVVLVIAGVNVTAMLSARAVARRPEIALRAALGAQRSRLVRQLVTETSVLFFGGSVGGLLLALAATRLMEQLPLATSQQLVISLPIDSRVVLFALAVSAVCSVAFGLLPALRAARNDLQSTMRSHSSGSGRRRPVVSNVLVVGQLALSMSLLVCAGLLVRALQHGQLTDPGFTPGNVSVASFASEAWGYDENRSRAFYQQLRERMEALPGVSSVSYAGAIPVTRQGSGGNIEVEGVGGEPLQSISVGRNDVDAGYFNVLEIRVLEGRGFEKTDRKGTNAVAVINCTLAKRIAPSGSALGRTLQLGSQGVLVVGVVQDAKYVTLDEAPQSFLYLPMAQQWRSDQSVFVRSSGGAVATAAALASVVRDIDQALPPPTVLTMTAAMSFSLIPQRVAALVAGTMGLAGLLLATVGLYGIIAYSTGQRRREIGIRMTLGAQRGEVLRSVLREGMLLAGLGVVVGLMLSVAGSRLLTAYLYGVSPIDAITYSVVAILFVGVTLVANYVPARRASLADPMVVLRGE